MTSLFHAVLPSVILLAIVLPAPTNEQLEKLTPHAAEKLLKSEDVNLKHRIAGAAVKTKNWDLAKVCLRDPYASTELDRLLAVAQDSPFKDWVVLGLLKAPGWPNPGTAM